MKITSCDAKILIVGAECAPFAKTGGLADVIGTLPGELSKLGLDVRVMLPLHSQIKRKYVGELRHICNFYVHLGWRTQYVGVESIKIGDIVYYFIDNEYYFGGPIYKGGNAEGEQYAYFCRAALEALPLIGFVPDIIHCNDWHTAAIPVLLRTQYQGAPQGSCKTLFTIHNLMYQGKFSRQFIQDLLGIGDEYFAYEIMGDDAGCNLLKGALKFADKISTVSPTYAEEIKYPYYAEGLEGALNYRAADTIGIINGIDTDAFNPQADEWIEAPYSCKDFSGKQKDKEALFAELGINMPAETPVIGMVSRLTPQKGLDLVRAVLGDIMGENVAFVVLGSGEREYEDFFREAAYRYCGRMAVRTEYNNALAHRIYAGSDFFLMPSQFEPCGISQMIALRYGTLPIVRETGGLVDTVTPYNEFTKEGNGFTFTNYNAHDMLYVIRMALRVYEEADTLRLLRQNAMAEDNSFAASAKEYKQLYLSML